MADQNAAKRIRSAAKAKFTRIENKINTQIDAKTAVDFLGILFEDLRNSWEAIEEKHDNYIGLADEGETVANEEWIKELEERYFNLRIKFMDYSKKTCNDEATKHALVLLETCGDEVTKCGASLENSMLKLYPKEIVQRNQEELTAAFDELKIAQNKLLETSTDEKHVTVFAKDKARLSKLNEQVDQYILDIKAKDAKLKAVQIEKLPLPKFDGNLRNYPRFKRDFVELILPQVSRLQAPFVLRQCLPSDIASYISYCDDDVDEMLKQLDKKYGDPGKLVESVLLEIRSQKRIGENDGKSLINFVNLVEKGYLDLKRLQMQSELCNANVISIIESRLPKDIGLEWYRLLYKQEGSIIRSNKFEKLLDYLKIERNALEYSLSDVRVDKRPAHVVDEVEVKNNCCLHEGSTHTTGDCRIYLNKTGEERVAVVKEKFACWNCLRVGHRLTDCPNKKRCGTEGCSRFHHASLHEAHAAGLVLHTENVDSSLSGPCLLLVMNIPIPIHESKANVMWDTASTISLITFQKADELNLKGSKVFLTITKTGGMSEQIRSYSYKVPLLDTSGSVNWVTVYGIPKISSYMNSIEVDNVLHLFQEVSRKDVCRTDGEVDILVGLDHAAFHPRMVQNHEHLVIYENRFGKCLGGTHPTMREGTKKLISHAYVNHNVSEVFFGGGENLGVEYIPHCADCRCSRCVLGDKHLSLKEEREFKLIDSGLELKGNKWMARYPWNRDPNELPDNHKLALAVLHTTEKRLLKSPKIASIYQDQMNEMVEKRYAREISQTELKEYNGPIHYICHHEVIKAESASTPCRIVFNSSQSFHGHVLNEYWAKGPDLINNLLGVLLRFRENYVALVADIRKMYHTISISYIDQHTHRFLWRDLKLYLQPKIYAMNVVSFGDKPAGTITMAALRKTAQMGRESHPAACKTLLENIYVDDILDSVTSQSDAEILAKSLEDVLKCGSFEVKGWTYSRKGKQDGVEDYSIRPSVMDVDCESQKVLGMNWNPCYDVFFYLIKLNFSKKVRNIRSGPDLHSYQVPEQIPLTLTKRVILAQINGFYDPLGLVSAFTVKAKILWRDLWIGEFKDKGWDDPIPANNHKDWVNFFKELFDVEGLTFERCLKPDEASNDPPILVLFSDGSVNAYGACAYIRWKMGDGSFRCRLVAAKCRVTPVKKITIVRIELNGAVLAKRLKEFIEAESRIKFSQVYFLIDSEVVLAMLQRDSYGFNTYVGLRIGEIQQATYLSSWYWVEGKLNVADWLTKGKDPNKLSSDGIWQKGPEFLQLEEQLWPVQQRCVVLEIPEQVRSVMICEGQACDTLATRIRIECISKYIILIRITARVLAMYKRNIKPSLKNALVDPCTTDYKAAEDLWIHECQATFTEKDMKSKYVQLCPQKRQDGIWVVGARTSKWVEISYNKQCVVLLPYSHAFSKLYARYIHEISHAGISATVSRIRLRFWVVNLHRMVKAIVNKCIPCIQSRKETIQQIMGNLPLERLKPAPAWHATALDYFGPYEIKGEVNRRSRRKCYGVLFNCLITRSVHLDIVSDYSTNSFMLVLRRFVTMRGHPSKLYSDNGSQLSSASKELKAVLQGLDWRELKAFGAAEGMEWVFSSADSPWQNGCSEALVKSCKKSLNHAIGVQILSYSEFQTVLYEAANIINERPIGRHPTDPNDGSYLCPNDLLLGRATSRVPGGPFRKSCTQKQRFEFVQQLADSFWKKMTRDYFPSLLVRKRWHFQRRNVAVGDVAIVQDSNTVRGEWKLAKVSKVLPDENGVVRNCELQYKQVCGGGYSKKYTTIKRSVQRILVLIPVAEEYVG